MSDSKTTTVTMTDEEAKDFLLFMKYKHVFNVLTDHNVFEVKNGSAHLNFNSRGNLASIVIEQHVYRLS